jgi:orotate phosphoribosyltransferase/AMMECR1 domain-containing protein
VRESPPARVALRAELQDLLRRHGILYSTPAAPITHRTGEVSEWAFYSWGITLTQDGLRSAARSILDALSSFGSTQLASYGYTGLPLLAACILEGGGAYTGLSVREKRKPHLTNRRIDGNVDRTRPVVVIDDSLSSGTSLSKAIAALEEEGLEVEGTVALVHFPYRGAKEWANAAGYRTVTLFDIWQDLGMASTDATYSGHLPERHQESLDVLPEGLSPPELARRAAEYFLRTRQLPRSPSTLDNRYDARGGTFVSFRQRADDERLARDGFWHFDPAQADPARDVVVATIDTLERSGLTITSASLPHLKIGVSFFGPLEEILPPALDFDRYGIVVRSKVWPGKLGGALPNTQVFISEIEQYRHARKTNARVAESEPHTLYRHTVTKITESSSSWPSYGCAEGADTSWWRDAALGCTLTDWARESILALSVGRPASLSRTAQRIPVPHEGVAVTLYANGLAGYGLSYDEDLAGAVASAAKAAWQDPRFADLRKLSVGHFALTVSVLHSGEALSGGVRALVERKVRRGLDAVTLAQDGRRTTLLPTALVYNNWTRAQFLDALEQVAGGRREHHSWRTHQVAAWVAQSSSVLPLRFGFPFRETTPASADEIATMIDRLGGYIFRSIDGSGLPAYYLGVNDRDYTRAGTAGRVIHALYALRIAGEVCDRRDWIDASANGVAICLRFTRDGVLDLPDHVGGALAESVLLAAASECGLAGTVACRDLARRVYGLVHASGWIGVGSKRLDNAQDQEFLPGAAVWAIGSHCRSLGTALPGTLGSARRFYGHRFSEHPTWGASWLAQGWATVHDVAADSEAADLAYAAADWLMAGQLEKSGAFLETLSPDEPSFNTGFMAEGIAGAWRTAIARGDADRANRYADSWRRAIGFMRTLMLDEVSVFPFRAPDKAAGGVRCTISRSGIRVDQVSHTLHALVEGWHMVKRGP